MSVSDAMSLEIPRHLWTSLDRIHACLAVLPSAGHNGVTQHTTSEIHPDRKQTLTTTSLTLQEPQNTQQK